MKGIIAVYLYSSDIAGAGGGGGTECYSQRFPAFPLPYSQNLLKYFSSGLEYIKVCN